MLVGLLLEMIMGAGQSCDHVGRQDKYQKDIHDVKERKKGETMTFGDRKTGSNGLCVCTCCWVYVSFAVLILGPGNVATQHLTFLLRLHGT